jgi:hypothetical protein
MHKLISSSLFSCLSLLSGAACAADLTEMETRWLTAALPVIHYAKQELTLPMDIVVQPQAGPNDVPLAMGYLNGRCKLVLSLRGNPSAEAILDKLPQAQRGLMIEAMAAHEIGHCWRQAQGVWHELPAGFAASAQSSLQAEQLLQTQREEGYADLLALAWIQQRHPGQYAEVADWLRRVREPAPGAAIAISHDTRSWLQLAASGAAFEAALPLTEQAGQLWRRGLASGE